MAHDHHHSNSPYTQTLEELDFMRSIHNACIEGATEKVRNIIVKKGSHVVNERDSTGYTPLHYATRNNHLEICRILLSHDADVNATTPELLSTPLHRAILINNQSLTSLLLLNGANCRLQDIDGQTPLHKACEKGYTDIAVMLVKRDRSLLEIKDNKGRTPIECCASEEMKTLVFKVGSEKG
ncbi:1009_t:CDS:2 [Paraglomus occultum]|uniref:1009_t:CDS:1 n=1 Tax=Paraglomus occultum TaxID=144539 RepID=A0A9N8YY12_9GLOM|nr:1009_t:CDS:2 [Paraglomus occultum]